MCSRSIITKWTQNSRNGWDKEVLGTLKLIKQGTLGWRLVPKRRLQEGRAQVKLSKTTEKTALVKERGKKLWSGLPPT